MHPQHPEIAKLKERLQQITTKYERQRKKAFRRGQTAVQLRADAKKIYKKLWKVLRRERDRVELHHLQIADFRASAEGASYMRVHKRLHASVKFHGRKWRMPAGREQPHFSRKLSVFGGYKLGSKRNRGHLSQLAAADTLELEVSRFTVQRWETLLSSSLVLGSRQFQQRIAQLVTEDSEEPTAEAELELPHKPRLTWQVHGVRCAACSIAES